MGHLRHVPQQKLRSAPNADPHCDAHGRALPDSHSDGNLWSLADPQAESHAAASYRNADHRAVSYQNNRASTPQQHSSPMH